MKGVLLALIKYYDLFKRKAAQEIELLFLLIILNIIYF